MIAIRFKLSNHCRFLTYSCFFSVIPEGGNHAAKNVRGSLEHCLELRRLDPPERTSSMPAQRILKPVLLVLVLVELDSLWPSLFAIKPFPRFVSHPIPSLGI